MEFKTKKILKILLILLIALCFTTTVKAVVYFGDVDEDGKVTSDDSRLILRYTCELEKFSDRQKKIADINGDKKITSADARLALRMATDLEKLKVFEKDTVILIGDSRTVGMYCTLASNWSDPTLSKLEKGTAKSSNETTDFIWSAKGSMGLNWMKSTGYPNIEAKIKKGTKVVVLMGTNDLLNGNKKEYISYLNKKYSEISKKGAKMYFVSVNPINDKKAQKSGYLPRNSDVTQFNKYMKDNLNKNIKYIDTYNNIGKENFETNDGVHYTSKTYKAIYNNILKKIK